MPRVALKVDCDTFLGTRDGIPRLLEILAAREIRATFFFTLGPDRSGLAARRVFTRKGFLRKMIRSRAPRLYPLRTMLSGTLLPAPAIGERCAAQIRSVAQAGHETGVHGWDHVRWQDRLERMKPEAIRSRLRARARGIRAPLRASGAHERRARLDRERALAGNPGGARAPADVGHARRPSVLPDGGRPDLSHARDSDDPADPGRGAGLAARRQRRRAEVALPKGGPGNRGPHHPHRGGGRPRRPRSSSGSWTTGARTASRSRCCRRSRGKSWEAASRCRSGRSRRRGSRAGAGASRRAGRRSRRAVERAPAYSA